jgi:hypothetical protein
MASPTDSGSQPKLGGLAVKFPPGWRFKYQEQSPIEGTGPNSEFTSISFNEAASSASDQDLNQYFEFMRGEVMSLLLAVAQDKGTVRRTPTKLFERGGLILFSKTSSNVRQRPSDYFLQYAFLSKTSHHYFSIGGSVSIEEATSRWDRVMREAVWTPPAAMKNGK